MVSSNRYKIKVQRNITLEVAVKIWSRAFIQPFIAKKTFQMTSRQKKKVKILKTELCFTFEFMILSRHDGIGFIAIRRFFREDNSFLPKHNILL